MLALKCPRCGRSIEVSDIMRGMEIPCARCGTMLVSNPMAPDPDKTEVGISPLERLAQAEVPGGVTNPSGGDETLIPKAGELPERTFSFLAPARAPHELGWLSHYQVLRLLGQGGMGYVFEALDSELKRVVALKVMMPKLALDESARQRFLREARAMAAVKNDHIVSIHHVGQHNNIPFLAMELLQGESLDKVLKRSGRLPLAEALRVSMEIGRGLAAAHARGLIHRDIKPANIWLEAPLGRVKILDFGLARLIGEESHLTQVGMLMGTPAYMAPEQVDGKEVDVRCDLFSLGCVMYEMCTGKPPFTGAGSMAILMAVATKNPIPPRELNPQLPPPLAKRILQLLAKNPEQRPASAREVVASLEEIAGTLGLGSTTASSGPAHVPLLASAFASPRRRWLAIAVTLFSCLLVGGVLGWLLMR